MLNTDVVSSGPALTLLNPLKVEIVIWRFGTKIPAQSDVFLRSTPRMYAVGIELRTLTKCASSNARDRFAIRCHHAEALFVST